MRLKSVSQSDFGQLSEGYAAVIGASGYESRARYVATALAEKDIAIEKRYVLAFKEHADDCARPENDKSFKALGYQQFSCSGSSTDDVRKSLDSVLSPLSGRKEARILIDISSMTRTWYGEVVHALLDLSRESQLRVDFAYTSAEFTEAAEEYPPNRVAGPVPGFVGLTLPDKPTALGIGLGYDRDRAIGLKDYLDPRLTVLFYPNPSVDQRYVQSVIATNAQIFGELSSNNVVAYPVSDFVSTFYIVNSLCEGLTRNSRVVLCSFGPKLFGLCCFLVASLRRDISIWRVSADDRERAFDHKALGRPSLVQTVWDPSDPVSS